jgi:hypothetical protein
MIFCGVPLCISGLFTLIAATKHIVTENVYPYVFCGMAIILTAFSMVAYNFIPKRLILPLGIAGWIISFSILCWMLWFGPLALEHTSSEW